ncbi:MAG: ribbon-helix-helix domain-containing protein [Pseudomonadota bacterium]
MAVRKRSVTIRGHATSYSVEDAFFEALQKLAADRKMSLAALITQIDETRPRDANLSSAIRMRVLEAAKRGELTDGTIGSRTQSPHQ